MRKYVIAACVAVAAASPAFATGKLKCDVPAAQRQPVGALEARLKAEGWTIKKSKLDGGCYEVYGTQPDGTFVEAYFDPATFEKLYVSQRGKVLFKKSETTRN
jgi:hypothetical protein